MNKLGSIALFAVLVANINFVSAQAPPQDTHTSLGPCPKYGSDATMFERWSYNQGGPSSFPSYFVSSSNSPTGYGNSYWSFTTRTLMEAACRGSGGSGNGGSGIPVAPPSPPPV